MIPLDIQIEALLFFKGAPMSLKELAKTLDIPESEARDALSILEEKLRNRGLQLVHKDNSVLLTTSASVSNLIEQLQRTELERDLGKAGLETLSIVLYRGPLSRSDIDYIRGVNSTYILRTLLIRGLVERIANPNDKRSHLYRPTFELLQYLGVGKVEELPEYDTVRGQIHDFASQQEAEDVKDL